MPLEYADRRVFDIGAQHRMQAIPRGDVDIHPELVFEQKLDPNQFEERECPVLIVLDKYIEIASCTCFIACDGAKQIERCGAERLDGFRVAFESCNCPMLVHRVRSIRHFAMS